MKIVQVLEFSRDKKVAFSLVVWTFQYNQLKDDIKTSCFDAVKKVVFLKVA